MALNNIFSSLEDLQLSVRVKGMSKAAISALVNNSPYCLRRLWVLFGGIDNSMCLCAISASPVNLLEHGLHIISYPGILFKFGLQMTEHSPNYF
ncbi:unnamed protein product [Leuciscus chuanchicus]